MGILGVAGFIRAQVAPNIRVCRVEAVILLRPIRAEVEIPHQRDVFRIGQRLKDLFQLMAAHDLHRFGAFQMNSRDVQRRIVDHHLPHQQTASH